MTQVREGFNPVPMAANAAYPIAGVHLGGFLAAVSGTITITGKDSTGLNAVTFVNAVPVTAGVYTPIPAVFPVAGAVVQLGGGAAGTLFV